jgi:hypothetical protein
MKNLANCKPSEFLAQTCKIKKSAERWLKATDIIGIRKIKPIYPKDATDEEKRAILETQAKANLSRMLDAILEEHPEETLELLALACFIEPEDADNHPVNEYLRAVSEMLSDKDVIGFFTSLTQLGQIIT